MYDIHSPRVPPAAEMQGLLEGALTVLRPEQLWVNPDCGLKTRQWNEVEPALAAMVQAARSLRDRYQAQAGRHPEAAARVPSPVRSRVSRAR